MEDAEGINRSADALLPVRLRFLGLDNGAAVPENAGPRSDGVGEALEDEEAPEVRVAESLLFVDGVGAVLVVGWASAAEAKSRRAGLGKDDGSINGLSGSSLEGASNDLCGVLG